MPFVNIRSTRATARTGRTRSPAASPRPSATYCKLPREAVWVVFKEVTPPDWYVAGKPGKDEVSVSIRDPRFTGVVGPASSSSSSRPASSSPRAALAPAGSSTCSCSDMPGDHLRRWSAARRRHHLPQALQQVQRAHVGPPGPPARLRARLEPGDAHRARRAHRAARHALRGQAAQQPQRHRLRGRTAASTSAIRPTAAPSSTASSASRSWPSRACIRVGADPKSPGAARRRLRPAQRALLLPRRPAALRQRHRPQAHPRLRRDGRRRRSPAAGSGRRRRAKGRARPTA